MRDCEGRSVDFPLSVCENVYINDSVVIYSASARVIFGSVVPTHLRFDFLTYFKYCERSPTGIVNYQTIQKIRPTEAAGGRVYHWSHGVLGPKKRIQTPERLLYIASAVPKIGAKRKSEPRHYNSGSQPKATRASSESMLWSHTGSKVSSIVHPLMPGVCSTLCFTSLTTSSAIGQVGAVKVILI